MFEISWSELFILVVVTLIFVKPKDLPYFFNTLGRYVGELKRQASEFRRHFEDAMREAEVENLRKELGEVHEQVRHGLDEIGNFSERVEKEGISIVKSSTQKSPQTHCPDPFPNETTDQQPPDGSFLRQDGDPKK